MNWKSRIYYLKHLRIWKSLVQELLKISAQCSSQNGYMTKKIGICPMDFLGTRGPFTFDRSMKGIKANKFEVVGSPSISARVYPGDDNIRIQQSANRVRWKHAKEILRERIPALSLSLSRETNALWSGSLRISFPSSCGAALSSRLILLFPPSVTRLASVISDARTGFAL